MKNSQNVANTPLVWTILVGCGIVCIRRTAHRSTGELGSCPFEGSLQRTNRSLQRIPYKGRGVCSGARHSTSTFGVLPLESTISNETVCFRTIRVNFNLPSMMSRLGSKSEDLHRNILIKAYLCGCTSGLGNFPRIRDCHWTSFRLDSASRFPSFIFVASEEISLRALSSGSSNESEGGNVLRISSSS